MRASILLVLLPACTSPFTMLEETSSNDSGAAVDSGTDVAPREALGTGDGQSIFPEAAPDQVAERFDALIDAGVVPQEAALICTPFPQNTLSQCPAVCKATCPSASTAPVVIFQASLLAPCGNTWLAPYACSGCQEHLTCACILTSSLVDQLKSYCSSPDYLTCAVDATGVPVVTCR